MTLQQSHSVAPHSPGASGGTRTVETLEADLLAVLADLGPIVVAFSGGVDSALLAVAAHRADNQRGDHQSSGQDGRTNTLAVTASSASLASGELDHCRQLAAQFGFRWRAVDTQELNDPRYLANDGDRCFWCKSALMDQLEPLAEGRIITLGVNLDDLGDHRPGQQAAGERGARFPLVEAGFSKAEVRTLAHHWSIPVWDRPAMPCLSSRIPYGTEVSVPLLSKIDRAEAALRQLGFGDVRVRHYDDTARIEVPAADLPRAATLSDRIVDEFKDIGYRYVTLDLAGLRSGNLNHAVPVDQRLGTNDGSEHGR